MSVLFTRDLFVLTGGDTNDDFQLAVSGNQRTSKTVSINVPAGQFIAGASITPIQNIPNYAKTIRRLTVDRAFSGNNVTITVRGTGNESRFRARLSVAITTFSVVNLLSNASGSPTDLSNGAFQLFANANGADGFANLPPANKNRVGAVFFFNNQGANSVNISTTRAIDKIVYGAGYDEQADAMNSGNTTGRSVILRCGSPKRWFVECIDDPAGWSFS